MKHRFEIISRLTNATAAKVGVLVIIGWVIDLPALRMVLPNFPNMSFNSAVLAIVAGLAMAAAAPSPKRPWKVALLSVTGAIVLAASLTVLAEFALNWNVGIDRLLHPQDQWSAPGTPRGRMPLLAAVNFSLFGLAMLLAAQWRLVRFGQVLACAVGVSGLVTMLGYVYSVRAPYHAYEVPMALPMAVVFCLLATGFLFARPEQGWMARVTSDTHAGAMARRLLPAALLLPTALGYLRVLGERFGLYPSNLGVALLVVSMILVFTLAVVRSVKRLDAWERTRERAEKAVRESEARFDLAARATSDAIWDWDLPTDSLWWNKGAQPLFGHDPATIGSDISWWTDHIHPDDRERVVAGIHGVIDTGRTFWRAEYRFRRSDNTYAEVLDRGYVARDQNGMAFRMIGAMQDLSEAKRAEHALRQSEQRFRAVFELSALGMARVRFSDARWIDVNGAFCRMLGYTPDEMRARAWTEMTHPDDIASDLSSFRRMAAGELETYTVQKRFIHKEGHHVWARLTLSLVRDRQGRPDYEIAVIDDISDRIKAEEHLRASEARERLRAEELTRVLRSRDEVLSQLNALLANAPVGFAFFDREHRYARLNEFLALKLNGLPIDAHLGRPVREVAPYNTKSMDALIDRVFETGQALGDIEIRAETPAQPRLVRHWLTAWFPVRTANGVTPWVGAAVMEITRQKHIEQQLAAAREALATVNEDLERKVSERTLELEDTIKELEAFSYSLIHDLRAPLRAMEAYGSALEEEIGGTLTAESKEYIRRIKVAAGRMDHLITDSFNYSKLVRHELPLGPVNVAHLLRDMVETYPNLQPPRAEVTVDLDDLVVLGNEAALTQVFSNLLGNAVKFVAPGIKPRVRVWSEPARNHAPRAPHVHVWVEDNGIGIPKEGHERIFGMFERMHRADEYAGTGIGLAIVRKSVERIGGRVYVDSEPGKGSRFCVELPLLEEAPALIEPKETL